MLLSSNFEQLKRARLERGPDMAPKPQVAVWSSEKVGASLFFQSAGWLEAREQTELFYWPRGALAKRPKVAPFQFRSNSADCSFYSLFAQHRTRNRAGAGPLLIWLAQSA